MCFSRAIKGRKKAPSLHHRSTHVPAMLVCRVSVPCSHDPHDSSRHGMGDVRCRARALQAIGGSAHPMNTPGSAAACWQETWWSTPAGAVDCQFTVPLEAKVAHPWVVGPPVPCGLAVTPRCQP